MLNHPGVYCLRSNETDFSEECLWRTFTLLTDVEAVYRSLKSELGLRPIHHRKSRRAEVHLFITVIDQENARTFRMACRLDARNFRMLQDIEQHLNIDSRRARSAAVGSTIVSGKAVRSTPRQCGGGSQARARSDLSGLPAAMSSASKPATACTSPTAPPITTSRPRTASRCLSPVTRRTPRGLEQGNSRLASCIDAWTLTACTILDCPTGMSLNQNSAFGRAGRFLVDQVQPAATKAMERVSWGATSGFPAGLQPMR